MGNKTKRTNFYSWKNEYWKLADKFEASDNSNKKVKLKYEMDTLLKNNIPSYLYRYRSCTDYSFEEVSSNNIWLSLHSEFNDPFDNLASFSIVNSLLRSNISDIRDVLHLTDYSSSELDVLQQIYNEYLNDEESMQYQSEQIQNDFSSACFSEDYDSMLMWSHYARNHEGFCIEYNFKNFDLHKFNHYVIAPIDYTTKRPQNCGLIHSSFSKYKDWSYEKEWRITNCLLADYSTEYYSGLKINSIILGAKISSENAINLISICLDKKINIYKMTLDNHKYKLNKVLIYDASKNV